jgi:hypothetical protein
MPPWRFEKHIALPPNLFWIRGGLQSLGTLHKKNQPDPGVQPVEVDIQT